MSTALDAHLQAVPVSARGIVSRAMDGTASPRGAIKAKCLDCCGFDRAEVAACTVWRCPLHAYRPFQPGEGSGVAEGSGFQPSHGAEVSEPQPEAARPVGARQGEARS